MEDLDRIIKVEINETMKKSYIEYAMSVIISRALPDARDGLKPVHRRILYGMWDMGIRYNTANKKCARIVGDVLGKYHPHGDSSIYGALVNMAQEWSTRYPLVDGHGNFGSVDGDGAAAMRYTEARLIRKMDELGIGRPSTYAPIITKIQQRNYVEKIDNKALKPTPLGRTVCKQLNENFVDIMDYKFTADMELKLDNIADNKANGVKVCFGTYAHNP